MLWLYITSVLSITQVLSQQMIDTSHTRVFPAGNKSLAGVFQVSYFNDLGVLEYAFNASEARTLCWSLGVSMASKAQVKDALDRGLETCRFGWVDEHFAVIPRRTALSTCGQNKTGLVTWRAAVTQKFDVFCFNESDAATQLEDTTTDNPLSSRDTQTPSLAAHSTQNTHWTFSSPPPPAPPYSSASKAIDSEGEPARFVGGVQGSSGTMAIIITSTCALVLIAVIIPAYIHMRRRRILNPGVKQQEEYIQTEQRTCLRNMKETKTAAQEDERIEMDSNAS
ncbi:lymphatic vessel endothelial hyaluronic acid receptor 1a [Brachionichthys hirsutus]|uniref:lymphatic vessel endothelial hyaluronic acid receptor 1a n=1 Tax=Brachionichthys hirsutus TaxID=412623 RepID=UPI0036046C82